MSIAEAVQRLSNQFADRCVTTDAMREQYAQNEAHHAPVRPDAVVFPESTDEVRQIMDVCRETGCPITPYGCLLYTSPSPRDRQKSRMPSSA